MKLEISEVQMNTDFNNTKIYFNPIFFRSFGRRGTLFSTFSNLSKIILNNLSVPFSSLPTLSVSDSSDANKCLILINVLTIDMFTLVATSLFNTPESATTPYSVKTIGRYFRPFVAFLKVPNWNL